MASKIVKCSVCNIVICEVLAFIQNKVDVMDEDSIVRVCCTSFSAEDIERAKCLLFESITTTKRKITRKRDGRTQRDLYDVIAILKETDPEETPIFVARELQKLPPVTFDHIDATRLLKDILILQKELKTVRDTYVTMDQLDEFKNELHSLKQSNNCEYVNKKRGGSCLSNSYFMDSGPTGLPHINEQTTSPVSGSRSVENISPAKCSPCSSLSHAQMGDKYIPHAHNYANRKTAGPSNESPVRAPARSNVTVDADAHMSQQAVTPPAANIKTLARVVGTDKEWKSENKSGEWIMVQRRRLKNRFSTTQGKATSNPNEKFKAADIKVSLFINNVSKETSESDIIDYIFNKSQIKVILQKVNTKIQRQYNAFKIEVPKSKLSLFLTDSFWPHGITFRKFVEFKKDKTWTTQQKTTAIIRD